MEKPWDRFKGTKEEWALYYLEYHFIPGAKDYDNIEDETWGKILLSMGKSYLASRQAMKNCDTGSEPESK